MPARRAVSLWRVHLGEDAGRSKARRAPRIGGRLGIAHRHTDGSGIELQLRCREFGGEYVGPLFDEFKTHLRANSTVLRSKTPDLVQQELWGLLLAHFAIRQLMAQAAWDRGLDPDRLSFTHALRVIKRKMPQAAALPP